MKESGGGKGNCRSDFQKGEFKIVGGIEEIRMIAV